MDEAIDLTMFDAGDDERPSSPHNTRETAIVIDDSDDDSDMAQKMPAASARYAENNNGGFAAVAGSLSAQTTSWSATAPSSPIHTCALPSCGRKGTNLKRCSACLSVHYCNATCQHSHWSDHRKECRITTNIPSSRNTTVKREQQYATSTSARVSMSPTESYHVPYAARSNQFSCSLCTQTFATHFQKRKHEKRCRKKQRKKKVKAERSGRGNQVVVKAEKQKAKEKEEGEEDVEEADDITYTSYRPQKLRFGVDHPDPVVENSTLSAVVPPEVEYNLAMPADILSGKLSNLQLEAIVYGCQRHLIDLPVKEDTSFDGGEVVVEKPVRAGFLLGDGAGEMTL